MKWRSDEAGATPLDVIHVVASTASDHGGPSRSIPALCSALAATGARVRLVTSNRADTDVIRPSDGVEQVAVPDSVRLLAGATRRSRFRRRLEAEVTSRRPTIIHDHGAWLGSNHAAAAVARRSGIPLVISTRGMFSREALSHSGGRKRAAWILYQRRVLQSASMLHATSEAEADDLRRLGLGSPIAVVPNGVEIPVVSSAPRSRRALCMTRLHPIKGIPTLLEAWARVRPQGWQLDLVGPDVGAHGRELRQIIDRLQLVDCVRILDAASETAKWKHYESAELFILPSLSENFGIAVAEALASGTPVITTTGTPWSHIVEQQCGWYVSATAGALADAIANATALSSEERRTMGARGRAFIAADYSWPRVATEMIQVYEQVRAIGQATTPTVA